VFPPPLCVQHYCCCYWCCCCCCCCCAISYGRTASLGIMRYRKTNSASGHFRQKSTVLHFLGNPFFFFFENRILGLWEFIIICIWGNGLKQKRVAILCKICKHWSKRAIPQSLKGSQGTKGQKEIILPWATLKTSLHTDSDKFSLKDNELTYLKKKINISTFIGQWTFYWKVKKNSFINTTHYNSLCYELRNLKIYFL